MADEEEGRRVDLGRRRGMLVDITVIVSRVLEAYILPISIYHSHQNPTSPAARLPGHAPPPHLHALGNFDLSLCIA